MFEKKINEYKERFLSGLETGEKVNPFELLANIDDENIVKYYISSEVLRYGNLTLSAIANTKIIDSESNNFNNFRELFSKKISQHIIFEKERFDTLIESAVNSCFNFALRPRIALEKFIFSNKETDTKENILQVLNYFNFYSYLISGIKNKLDESGNEITKDDFVKMLTEVDNDYVYNISPDEFLGMLSPIFKLFNPNSDEHNELSAEVLLIFFDDKGIDPLIEKLEDFLSETGRELLTKEEVGNLLGISDTDQSGTNIATKEPESSNSDATEVATTENNDSDDKLNISEQIETLVKEIPSAEGSELDLYSGDDALGDLKKELNSFQALQEEDMNTVQNEKIGSTDSQDFDAMAEELLNGNDIKAHELVPEIEVISTEIDLSAITFENIESELEQMTKSLENSSKKDKFISLSDFNTEFNSDSLSELQKEIHNILEEIS
jgi:hypothetical protein